MSDAKDRAVCEIDVEKWVETDMSGLFRAPQCSPPSHFAVFALKPVQYTKRAIALLSSRSQQGSGGEIFISQLFRRAFTRASVLVEPHCALLHIQPHLGLATHVCMSELRVFMIST